MTFTGLDDDQRYRAVKSRDARFDGIFVVGVRTTGIYCRPSCPTPVQPLRKNVDFFATNAAAQRAGLRACKRCRPDATPGSPEWNMRRDLVGRAMRLINHGYLDHHSVADLGRELALSERHLRRIMIDAVGAPPLAIARAQRAQTARVLIETTAMSFTDVAFAAGFSSLRQFNDTVREIFDMTPTQLRRRRGGVAHKGSLSLRLPFRAPIAGDYLVNWTTNRAVRGVTDVVGATITTALRLRHGVGLAHLRIRDEWVDCSLELDDVADLAGAVAQCRTMLDLDSDPGPIEDVLRRIDSMAEHVRHHRGLRSPGSSDGFATLIFAILGQQRSVAAARTLAGRIVAAARQVAGEPADRLLPFPGPAEIAELNLEGIGLTKRNTATIHAVSRLFDDRIGDLSPGADRDAVRGELLSVSGIGPWTADYVAMRVHGDPDVYLGGDLVANRAAATLGLTAEHIAGARPWRSYLTHHLWAASSTLKGSL